MQNVISLHRRLDRLDSDRGRRAGAAGRMRCRLRAGNLAAQTKPTRKKPRATAGLKLNEEILKGLTGGGPTHHACRG